MGSSPTIRIKRRETKPDRFTFRAFLQRVFYGRSCPGIFDVVKSGKRIALISVCRRVNADRISDKAAGGVRTKDAPVEFVRDGRKGTVFPEAV